MVRAALQFLTAACLVIGIAAAQESKPRVPPGRDPGGVAVALFSTGIDYTLPALAARLARDGEGELIGWDFADSDNRPLDRSAGKTPANWGGDGTRLAHAIVDGPVGIRLVAVRIDPGEPATLARAVAFIARTPARVAVLPMWSTKREMWEPFRQAAARFQDILFVVAAGDEGKNLDNEPAYPASFGLPNVLVVTAATAVGQITPQANWGGNTVDAAAIAETSIGASVLAAQAAAASLAREPALRGAALKRKLIEASLLQRKEETPRKTRSLSIIASLLIAPMRGRGDPALRILDKTRVPERVQ